MATIEILLDIIKHKLHSVISSKEIKLLLFVLSFSILSFQYLSILECHLTIYHNLFIIYKNILEIEEKIMIFKKILMPKERLFNPIFFFSLKLYKALPVK